MSEARRAHGGLDVLFLTLTLALCCGCGSSPLSRQPDGGAAAGRAGNDAAEDRAPGTAGGAPAPDSGGPSGGGGGAGGAGAAAGDAGAAAGGAGATDAGAGDAAEVHLESHVDGGRCVPGFAHCTTNAAEMCETSIATADNCGSCTLKCSGATPACVLTSNGVAYRCVADCPAGLTHCGKGCFDLQTDPSNCGSCDVSCSQGNVAPTCKAGVCQTDACHVGFATCGASTAACTTRLDSAQNCGACGNPACTAAHTLLTCSGGTACDHPVCSAGFANCDATSPDCETAQGAAGACFPSYKGTSIITGSLYLSALTLGPDGSIYLVGGLEGATDFDPGPGKDSRAPKGTRDAFIEKLTPEGKEAWTITLGGATSDTTASALALSGTSLLVLGSSTGDVDFDPGPGTTTGHVPANGTATWIASYTLDGQLGWVRTYMGSCGGSQITVDAAGAMYVAGGFTGTCAFDAGAADRLTSAPGKGNVFLAKLGSDGKSIWSRSVTGDTCESGFPTLVASADGNLWMSGGAFGSCGVAGTTIDTIINAFFTASFTPAGDVRFAFATVSGNELVAAPDGSVYVGGLAGGTVDFDPGPGATTRSLPGNDGNEGGFIERLAADGTFRWVQTTDHAPVSGAAATADSGVIVGGTKFVDGLNAGYLVAKIGADSTPVWSLGLDTADDMGIGMPAVTSSSLVISGQTDMTDVADIVPGPPTVAAPAHSVFLLRYGF